MKGEKINILNIEKNIRNGISDLKENGKVQEGFKKTGGFISEILIAIGRTLLKILKIILKILAGILWIFSIIIALLLVAALIPIHLTELPFSIPTALGIFGLAPAYSIIAVFLICIIPFILLIWLTSKYLFRFKNRNLLFPAYADYSMDHQRPYPLPPDIYADEGFFRKFAKYNHSVFTHFGKKGNCRDRKRNLFSRIPEPFQYKVYRG